MSVIRATGDLFKNCFRLNGRLSRAGYWWGFLGYVIILIICTLADQQVEGNILTSLCSLIFFIPLFTAAARRFHDCGRSTAFLVVLYILEFIFCIMSASSLIFMLVGTIGMSSEVFGSGMIIGAVGVIGFLIVSIVTFVGLVKPSEPGPNRWGDPVPFNKPDELDEVM